MSRLSAMVCCCLRSLCLKRELGRFARDIKDNGLASLCGYVETNEVDVVSIYDRRKKHRIEVDRKTRECDRKSVRGCECRPMVCRYRGHAFFILNDERT